MSDATVTPANGEAPATDVVARRPDRTPLAQRDPVVLAKHFMASGYFKDTKSMSQAVVKVVAGEELGLGPMTAMNGIHIIEGKPSLSANLMGTLVKRSESYNYRPTEVTDTRAAIDFFEDGEEVGSSEFTIKQAQRAGLVRQGSGWTKYPEAMLFARALSQGIRWYCPDVTSGSPAYTPEELGADVDQAGDPLPGEIEDPVVEVELVTLDPDTVEQLAKGIDAAGLTLDDLNIVLGALGIDALDPNRDRNEQLAELSDDQAAVLDADLQGRVDAEAGEGNGDD